MFLNVGVQDSKSIIVDASTKVVPHMTNNAHICRFHKCILVVLDGGNERVDSVMCLCARFGAKLVRVESVVGLGVCRKSG